MKVDLSYTEINWIVSALNHKIVDLEEEMKTVGPDSGMGRLVNITITNNRDLIIKMMDVQNDIKTRK